MNKPPLKRWLDGEVLHLQLSRPERHNAFDEELAQALLQEAAASSSDPQARVVVLEGEGPSFCAGADVDWMLALGEGDGEENLASAKRLAQLFKALDRLTKPLVGRIHGNCLGGGVGLAAVCDIAVADSGCRFALSEVRLGILPAVIAPYVARKIGLSRARELMLTGRRFSAEEACKMGLVHHVADPSSLNGVLSKVVQDLLQGGPNAQAQVKELLREIEEGGRRGKILADWTAEEIARGRSSDEGRAGLAAFLDKAAPPWAPQKKAELK
ncbi:MAG: enoyl-CoA hydratase/isomerase family protein [Planctomycetes bacterium]|nr:enoyl-CoA hydratase/isomerase family protein [Planctomycetota bacterium]